MIKLPRDAVVSAVCGLSGRPVGLVCERCGHRGTVPFRHLDVTSEDDARPLYGVAGRCPACQDRDGVALFMFPTQAALEEFQKTLPPRPPLRAHSTP